MSESGEAIDIRGEPCGMPALRVEKFMDGNRARAPFSVIADDRAALETIEALAARRGFTCAVESEPSRGWRGRFRAT